MNIYQRDVSQSAETSGTATMKENKRKAQLEPGWREQGDGLDGGHGPRRPGQGSGFRRPRWETRLTLMSDRFGPRSTPSSLCCPLQLPGSPFHSSGSLGGKLSEGRSCVNRPVPL